MQELRVDWIHGVLHDLEPVTRNDRPADVFRHVLPHQQIPVRNHRGRLGSQIRPDKAGELLDRIRPDADAVFEGAGGVLGLLEWLLQARAVGGKPPPVVGTPQALRFRYAQDHARAAMGTPFVDETQTTGAISIEDEALAKQANRL